MKKLSSIITYFLVTSAALIFLFAAVPIIFFPYEAHWMEGAMLSEVSWILAGNPLYTAPSIYHVPSVYQPLYYYITAALASISVLTFTTARFISVLATSFTLAMIYYVVRRETDKFFYAIAGIGLYIAAYGKTEFSYVSARIDPLLTCLIVAATIVVYYSKSYRGLSVGAFLFALSFFTKQSALVFIPFVCFYLLVAHKWKDCLFFIITSTLVILFGIILLNLYFDGWYSFYTLKVLRSMADSARWGYAIHGFFMYIVLRCWPVATLALLVAFQSILRMSQQYPNRTIVYFGLFFASGIIAGFLGILNAGGGHNVLLQAAAGCAIFLPIIASEISKKERYRIFVLWLIPVQLLLLISNPWSDSRNIATRQDKENYRIFFSYVSSLPGEVWIPYHGYLLQYTGKKEYAGFDFAEGAMVPDDERAFNLRNQFDTAYTHAHWSHILSDYKQQFPHYRLVGTLINLNKLHGSDDSLLYLYVPEK